MCARRGTAFYSVWYPFVTETFCCEEFQRSLSIFCKLTKSVHFFHAFYFSLCATRSNRVNWCSKTAMCITVTQVQKPKRYLIAYTYLQYPNRAEFVRNGQFFNFTKQKAMLKWGLILCTVQGCRKFILRRQWFTLHICAFAHVRVFNKKT